MKFYLWMFSIIEKMESETKTALTYADDPDYRVELRDTIKFLEERRMVLESLMGRLRDD